MIKKIVALLSAAVLLVLPALAEDPDLTYSGVLDAVTGEPITAVSSSAAEATDSSGRIRLQAGEEYDPETGLFVFTLSRGAEVTSTVADGMVTAGKVSISVPTNAAVTLYCNGNAVEGTDFTALSEPGSYVMLSQNGSGLSEQVFSFTIVNEFTALTEYRIPAGFAATDVFLDGVEQPFTNRTVDLSQEGYYRIEYGCLYTELPYVLEVSVDHTAPVLELKEVKDGVARGAVDISDRERDVSLLCVLDGEKISVSNQLTKAGNYTLRLEDPAGNVTTYQFTIGVYLNISAWVFVGIIAAVIAVTALYLMVSRKKLRIR